MLIVYLLIQGWSNKWWMELAHELGSRSPNSTKSTVTKNCWPGLGRAGREQVCLVKNCQPIVVVQLLSGVQLFVTLWTVSHRVLCLWNSPGKNIGGGCCFLLQGIFMTQRSNLHLLHFLHWQVSSLPLQPPGKHKRSLEESLILFLTLLYL